MLQQIIALIIIIFLVSRIVWQKKKKQINNAELIFWTSFWFLAAIAIIFIKKIDNFLNFLGFSGSGIEILFYVAVIILFYTIFKLRVKMEKLDRNITKLTREIALNNKKKYE